MKSYRLQEICARLSSGNFISSKNIQEKGKYAVFGGNGCRGYTSTYNFSGECVIIGRQGAYCGNVIYFKGSAYMTEHAVVVCTNEICNIRYLGYVLSTMRLGRLSHQAAQPGLSVKVLANQVIELPPLPIQERIADILSAYDDLIENNQKQIKLLEEAAQRLYKEWFVDFRFPGHETTPIVDSIPEGWGKYTVAQCLSEHMNGGWGKDSATAKSECAGYVIRGTDIGSLQNGNYNDLPLRFHSQKEIDAKKLNENDLIFELSNGNINNIGRCLIVDKYILSHNKKPTICASFCKLLRPKTKIIAILLFQEIQYLQESGNMLPYKKHGANGINNFAFEDFLQHEVIVPDDFRVDIFEKLRDKISILRYQIAQLKEARDRLLPKLMNGEIDVMEKTKKEMPSDRFDHIRRHWENVSYDPNQFAIAARADGQLTEEEVKKLKEIAEEE